MQNYDSIQELETQNFLKRLIVHPEKLSENIRK